jgi:hypothetical protein
MKTRIIQTRFWDDLFVSESDIYTQHLYIYLLTSQYINLCGIFQLPENKIKFECKLTDNQFQSAKENLEKAKKVLFKDGWVYVVNAERNNGYRKSPKCEPAYDREYSLIPKQILDFFDSTIKNMDSTIENVDSTMHSTHKSEIINNKSEIINKKEKNIELAENVLKWFNKAMETNYTSYAGFKDNLDFWSEIYSEEDIKKALLVLRSGNWWAKNPTPALLFRRKSPKGEAVDYIGELLNLKGGDGK